ncbi:alpha-1,2-fucosyltransferase [Chloroflexota bacterium]
MIIVRLKGGLGNQLFQYACGRALAHRQCTSLKLDTTWFAHPKFHYSLDRFNISATVASDLDIAITTRGPNNLRGRIDTMLQMLKPYYKRRYVHERTWDFDPNILRVSKEAYLHGYWGSPKYFSNIADILRNELTLVEAMDSINCEYAQRIQNCNSVSVHIRRGDYLEVKYLKMLGVLSIEYYQRAIRFLAARIDKPHFFIFSDDIDWCRDNIRLDYEYEFVSHNGTNADHMDLVLISLCQHHIIANSTFSWWGAWLSNRSKMKIVIAPQKYGVDPRLNCPGFNPEDWIMLEEGYVLNSV